MTLERERIPELMDRADVNPRDLARALRDLRLVNRWLLGSAPAVEIALRLARRTPSHPVRILDVATGSADIPARMARAARRSGLAIEVLATDVHPTTLDYARAATRMVSEITVGPADALALPFPAGSFDIAMCHTMLHHLERPDAVRAVRELARVARWGVVATDLRRSSPALLGTQLLATTLWRRHAVTRHDGPASIRAAFTPAELERIGEEALSEPFTVRRHSLFRMSLTVDRTRSVAPPGREEPSR